MKFITPKHYLFFILAFAIACSDNDDLTPAVDSAKFKQVELPEKTIQNTECSISGKVKGDISKVKLYQEDELIKSMSVIGSKFSGSFILTNADVSELQLKGENAEGSILVDSAFTISVIRQKAQAFDANNLTNNLGIWIWYLEETGFESHKQLAERISSIGVKRAFIKVADGRSFWSEINDIDDFGNPYLDNYQSKGLEVWAWSYNYPDNEEQQAKAIYEAAKSGFSGYILDIEAEFDNNPEALDRLLFAFYEQMAKAIKDGLITDNFPLLVTTWGNPKDHAMDVAIIDKYVDAHMPQTYIEKWGGSWLENPENTIDVGYNEYRSMGAKKPIFHIISAENVGTQAISPEILNRALIHAGPNTSIWKIPGENMGGGWQNNWDIINSVKWNYSYN